MDSNDLTLAKLEHKHLHYSLIVDLFSIVGEIPIFRQPAMSMSFQLLGSLMIIITMIFIMLSFRIRSSK